MHRKNFLWGAFLVISAFVFFLAGIFWPTPEPGRSKKLYCAQQLDEQVEKAAAIYEVKVLSSRETHPGSGACVYDLGITAIILGSQPLEKYIKSFVEEERFINPNAESIKCKTIGSNYLLLTAQEPSDSAVYRCGYTVLHEQAQKPIILDIIKKKGA